MSEEKNFKNLFNDPKTYIIIFGSIIVLGLGIIIYKDFHKPNTVLNTSIKQNQQQIQKDQNQVQKIQKKVNELSNKEEKIQTKIIYLYKERNNIQKPKTSSQIVKDFHKLGYKSAEEINCP